MTWVANIASLEWCKACGGTGGRVIDDSVLHEGSGFEVEGPKCEGIGVLVVEGFPTSYTAVEEDGTVLYDG